MKGIKYEINHIQYISLSIIIEMNKNDLKTSAFQEKKALKTEIKLLKLKH